MTYYSEFDPHAAAWLRELIAAELIPNGHVDERDIRDVTPDDLRGYVQCHFFAGIGGWPLALDLAGWPRSRPVWTGSCPCQPFSSAGKRKGKEDERHLWPDWFRLIDAVRPDRIFGEQVPGAVKHGWWDDLCDDVEAAGYSPWACDLPACSIGSPTIRQRLFWGASRLSEPASSAGGRFCRDVGDAAQQARLASNGRAYGEVVECGGPTERIPNAGRIGGGWRPDKLLPGEADAAEWNEEIIDRERSGADGRLSDLQEHGRRQRHSHAGRGTEGTGAEGAGIRPADDCSGGGLSHAGCAGSSQLKRQRDEPARLAPASRFDLDYCDWLDFLDGKTRPIEPGLVPLVDGLPFRLADGRTGRAAQSRAGILKGIGNAIVPATAAAFIQAYMSGEL